MQSSGFLHNYYDWEKFEQFVKELYEADGDVVVEHDVTEVDRYGAKRQTDIKITRRTRFHTYVTLVECKRWKEPVSRDRVDVLASSIEALGAQKGAIFTTTGFEAGAIEYAKGKQVDIFVVRDLTPAEWGLPGRNVHLRLHTWAGEFREFSPGATLAIPLVDPPVDNLHLEIHLDRDMSQDPDLDLRSLKTGARGPNLVSILAEAHGMILRALSKGIELLRGGKDGERLEIIAASELVLSGTSFRQLRLPFAALKLERVGFKFVASVTQSDIKIDRGANYDFALVVENYISQQRQVAHRRKGSKPINFSIENLSLERVSDAVVNGTLFSVISSPWIGIGDEKPTLEGVAGNLIRIIVETHDNGSPRLSLESVPLKRQTEVEENEERSSGKSPRC